MVRSSRCQNISEREREGGGEKERKKGKQKQKEGDNNFLQALSNRLGKFEMKGNKKIPQ